MGEKISLFNGNFDDVLEETHNTYSDDIKLTREHWKSCPVEDLHIRMIDRLDDFDTSEHSYHSLLRVIYTSLMLAKRLKDNE